LRKNPEFWKKDAAIKANMITLMSIHGNLCLALRHPQNKGRSRQYVVEFVKKLGRFLVETGAITEEQLAQAERLEAEEGSSEFGGDKIG